MATPPREQRGADDITETEAWCPECQEMRRFERRAVLPSPTYEQPDTRPAEAWMGRNLGWVDEAGHVRKGLITNRGYDEHSGTTDTDRAGPAGPGPGSSIHGP